MVPSTLDMEPSTLDKKIYSNISVKSVFKLFLRHFLLYGGSSTEQKTFLGSHSYSKTCYQVTCSVPPPPLPPHPTSRANMDGDVHEPFVFPILFICFPFFQKKKLKNCCPRPSAWYPRPSTLDLKTDSSYVSIIYNVPPICITCY